MFNRVPQPPVNPARRDVEHHDFWPGSIMTLIGIVLVLGGAQHLTSVDTVEGSTASEVQLMKAFSSGGLQYPDQQPLPPPPVKPDDAALRAEVLERWARDQARATTPTWKVRVDTGAKTPCPT